VPPTTELIVNGSFEEHDLFDQSFLQAVLGYTTTGNNATMSGRFLSYLASANTTFKGPVNGADPDISIGQSGNAIMGAWSNPAGWAQAATGLGAIGMPNGWRTTSNTGSGNATNPNNQPGGADGLTGNFVVRNPGVGNAAALPNATVTDWDFHGRWTWWQTSRNATHYWGQVGSVDRVVQLGRASLYFGTGATQPAVFGITTFGTVPVNTVGAANAGIVTLNGTLAANTTFTNNHTLFMGLDTSSNGTSANFTVAPNIAQTLTNLTVNRTYRLIYFATGENNERAAGSYNNPFGLMSVQFVGGNASANVFYNATNGGGYNPHIAFNGTNGGDLVYLQVPGALDTNQARYYHIDFVARNATTTVIIRDYGHLDVDPPGLAGFSGNSSTETIIDGISAQQLGSLGNRVWTDTNNNGVLNGGETGISGVTLFLNYDLNADGDTNDAGEGNYSTTTTNATGFYLFDNLPAGNYTVRIPTPPASATLSSNNTTASDNQVDNDDNGIQTGGNNTAVTSPLINLASGEIDHTIDFGFTAPASIGNQVWIDADNDGVFDVGESGSANVTVQLQVDLLGNGTFVAFGSNTTTNGTGNYAFTGLPPGIYRVVVPTPPAGFPLSSTTTDLADNQQDNDDNGNQTVSGGSTTSPAITLTSGETDGTIDFGFTATAALGNQVWIDTDNNGLLNGAEVGVNGVIV